MEVPFLVKRFFELLGYENIYLYEDLRHHNFQLYHSSSPIKGDKRISTYRPFYLDNKPIWYVWRPEHKQAIGFWFQFSPKITLIDFVNQISKHYTFLNMRDKTDYNRYIFPKDELELALLETILEGRKNEEIS